MLCIIPDGAEIELLVINHYEDDHLHRQETFDIDDLALARERFDQIRDELGGDDESASGASHRSVDRSVD